jgi:hypothetical protein
MLRRRLSLSGTKRLLLRRRSSTKLDNGSGTAR